MQTVEVAEAEEAAMARLLADAFAVDPFVSWMYPNQARRHDRFRRLMLRLMAATRPVNRVLRTDEDGACALWIPPGTPALSNRAQRQMIGSLPGFSTRLPRVLAVLNHMDQHHPRDPHWYLFVVGSDPARRGQGHGQAVIDRVLADCDRDGLPAYLESSNPTNVPYYERFGFQVTGTLSHAGSPPLIPMWRTPRH